MRWKSKGKTVYVDDPKNPKGWKGVAQTFSESSAKFIVWCVNKHKRKEVSGDISVETALEVENIARWIHAESDEPISEIEDLLLRMSTKDFYDEYAVVLKDLKERVI